MKPKTLIFLLFVVVMMAQVSLFWDIRNIFVNLFIRFPLALGTGMFFGRWAGKQE